MSNYKEIMELHMQGLSGRKIAAQLRISRGTVRRALDAVAKTGIDADSILGLTEAELERTLFPPEDSGPIYVMPDPVYLHEELKRPGVTLRLLWQEYADRCEAAGELHYQYSRFCDLYRNYTQIKEVTAPIVHKPGQRVMVDWAGKTMQLTDPETGNTHKVYLFVGTLPYSMYTFVRACPSMDERDWINAHAEMFEFFGGVSEILTCDNTKTAILHNRRREDPEVNRVYQEMARHYGTAISPARVRRPKDKAAVESMVRVITEHIIAPLRDTVFNTIGEINDAIRPLLEKVNKTPFQKRSGSRYEVFMSDERQYLKPLPALRYEMARWKTAAVQKNCHVYVDGTYYSVPYEHVGKRVSVRIDSCSIQIFLEDELICSHDVNIHPKERYVTDESHLDPGHRAHRQWSASWFLRQAQSKGPAVRAVAEAILSRYEIEEQAYRSLQALIHYPDKYRHASLNAACEIALSRSARPTLKSIETILQDLEKKSQLSPEPAASADSSYALTRGDAYYRNN